MWGPDTSDTHQVLFTDVFSRNKIVLHYLLIEQFHCESLERDIKLSRIREEGDISLICKEGNITCKMVSVKYYAFFSVTRIPATAVSEVI